ncbi:M23 family metallopeptidase [Streptomyces sp. E11-3]|uniref:M23 family metallopeptidase n=1 Tax=Streptomyces sp. E11-3 TaxID=3110112 RepID=UPI00397F879A
MTLFRRQLYGITAIAVGTACVLTAPPGAVAESASSWTSPITVRAKISAPYGGRSGGYAGRHTGVDFAVRTGTPVRAVGPGRVVLAARSGNYGKAVTIRMTDGRYTLYTHLSRISVRVGQRVRAKTRVGRSGATGRVTGPHLHFEVRARRGYGSDINPLSYLARHGVRVSTRAMPLDPASVAGS